MLLQSAYVRDGSERAVTETNCPADSLIPGIEWTDSPTELFQTRSGFTQERTGNDCHILFQVVSGFRATDKTGPETAPTSLPISLPVESL